MIARIIFSLCLLIGFAHNFPTDQKCGFEAQFRFSVCFKVFELDTKSNTTTVWESTKKFHKCASSSKICKQIDQSVLAFTLTMYFGYIETSKVFGHCLQKHREDHPCSELLDRNIDLLENLSEKCDFLGDELKNCTIQSMEEEKCGDFEIGEFVKIHDDMVETVGCAKN